MAKNSKKLATQQSVDSAIWAICDVTRRGMCITASPIDRSVVTRTAPA